METTHAVWPAMLTELARRIVEVVQPRRIILFGSAACGQMGPHSDLDVLVIMPDGVHRQEMAGRCTGRCVGSVCRRTWLWSPKAMSNVSAMSLRL